MSTINPNKTKKAIRGMINALGLNEHELGFSCLGSEQRAGLINLCLRDRIGDLYKLVGKWADAVKLYTDCIRAADDIDCGWFKAEGRRNLGYVLFSQSDYENALPQLEKAREIFEKNHAAKGLASTLGNIGSYYLNTGAFDKAVEYFEKQMDICDQAGSEQQKMPALNNLGVVYLYQGDYQKALGLYRQLLPLSEKYRDQRCMGSALGNMGLIYDQLGDNENALSHMERDLAIQLELGDKNNQARANANIGNVYFNQGDYSQSLKHLKACVDLCLQIGDRRGESYALGLMGSVHSDMEEYDKALDHFDRALAICRQINVKYFIASFLMHKTEALIDSGQPEKAQMLYEEAWELASALKVPDYIYRAKMIKARLESITDGQKAVESFENILLEYPDESNRAPASFFLAVLKKDAASIQKALVVNEARYESTKSIACKKRADHLRAMLEAIK